MLALRGRSELVGGLLLTASMLAMPHAAFAQDSDSPEQAATGSFADTNPNLKYWNLIQLTATDAASAFDGSGVKVAVLDGKADCRDAALVNRCTFSPISGGTYGNYNAHATHVSGIVGANPFGAAPAATILNYGVFGDAGYVATGTKLSDTWKSAYGAGAQISSMSFACVRKALCLSAFDLTTMASTSLPMLFVKAAGNDGADLLSETTDASSSIAAAALNKTLIVGSVSATGAISPFSNRPGTGCLLAQGSTNCSSALSWANHFIVAPGESVYSTMPNDQAGYMSGTSMATPVVAGVAALLQARWPFLKNSPETLANILLTSATDLGDPGVDPVFGFGLLNAHAAFVASGSVTIVAPITISGSTPTTTTSAKGKPSKGGSPSKASVQGGSFAGLGLALGGVTVFDQFGRDYRWDESGTLVVRQDQDRHQMLSRRLLGNFTQASWAPALFAADPKPRSFAFSGSATDALDPTYLSVPSLRMGIDIPLGQASVQTRFTGATNTRADLAFDPTMRSLAFFPSLDLANGSVITNLLLPVGPNSRMMVYGTASTGALEVKPADVSVSLLFANNVSSISRSPSEQDSGSNTGNNSLGAGFWHQSGSGVVWGANLSVIRQKNAFYDTAFNLPGFDRPTRMFNAGFAISKTWGRWDLTAATEASHLRTSSRGQSIELSPTTLLSAEVAVSRSGVFLRKAHVRDSLRAAISLPPRSVAGNLRLNYMSPTADGLQLQPVSRSIDVAEFGHQAMRFEAAYKLTSNSKWSLEVSGGVDLERTLSKGKAAEGLISLSTSL